ncbi:MAG: cyclic nucleotide-binding domain-containing protein, partial [Actinomycetota bacterium]|nr:cyclic nucleotide-binding domain-containing protein [Actinomycetota bacterium]
PFTGRELSQLGVAETIGMNRELYEPGQVIVRQGDVGRRIHLVASGEVAVVRESDDGTEEHLATLAAGDHFGEVAIFKGVRRTATVRAVTRVELLNLGEDVAVSLSDAAKSFGDVLRSRLTPGNEERATSKATENSEGPKRAPRTHERDC